MTDFQSACPVNYPTDSRGDRLEMFDLVDGTMEVRIWRAGWVVTSVIIDGTTFKNHWFAHPRHVVREEMASLKDRIAELEQQAPPTPTTKEQHMTDYEYEDRNYEDLTIGESLERHEAYVYTSHDATVYVPKAEAPRAAAALLRAAGWGNTTPVDELKNPDYAAENSVNGALGYLDAVIAKQDAEKAKEADKAKLHDEARQLFETSVRAAGMDLQKMPWLPENTVNVAHWEAIARHARTLHKK
jgi:hypothetical protein